MNKLLYVCRIVLNSIWRKKAEKAGLVFVFAFSLFFPILILYFTSFIHDQIAMSNFRNEEYLAGVEFPLNSFSDEDIPEIISSSDIIRNMIHNTGAMINVEVKGKLIQHPCTLFEMESDLLIHTRITEGDYFDKSDFQNGSPVCILTTESIKELGLEIDIGSSISIDGKDFLVIGITDSPMLNNYIILPYQTYKTSIDEMIEKERVFFLILSEMFSEDISDQLGYFFSDKIHSEPIDIWSYTNFNQSGRERSKSILLVLFFVSMIIFVYSIVNLLSVLALEFQKVKKTIGIKLALGGEKKHVLMEYSFEYFILAFIATVVVHLLTPLALAFLRERVGFYIGFDVWALLLSFLFPFITAFIISISIRGRIWGLNIKDVMKR